MKEKRIRFEIEENKENKTYYIKIKFFILFFNEFIIIDEIENQYKTKNYVKSMITKISNHHKYFEEKKIKKAIYNYCLNFLISNQSPLALKKVKKELEKWGYNDIYSEIYNQFLRFLVTKTRPRKLRRFFASHHFNREILKDMTKIMTKKEIEYLFKETGMIDVDSIELFYEKDRYEKFLNTINAKNVYNYVIKADESDPLPKREDILYSSTLIENLYTNYYYLYNKFEDEETRRRKTKNISKLMKIYKKTIPLFTVFFNSYRTNDIFLV